MRRSSVGPARNSGRSASGLAGWVALCFAMAAIGARASIKAGDFYGALVRPSWAPPAWLFGPAWTLLYTLMAIAAWLVWRRAGSWLFFAARRAVAAALPGLGEFCAGAQRRGVAAQPTLL